MKSIKFGRILALVVVLVVMGVTYYYYQAGEIAFLPQEKEKSDLTESFTAQIPIGDKEYQLSYEKEEDMVFDIASFETGESWYGDGDFDYSVFYEGESSLFLTSFNDCKSAISFSKGFDISRVANIKFLVHLATDPINIKDFNLAFSGEEAEYKFPIREINKGWNLLVLPKDMFSQQGEGGKIKEVVVELVSRPKTRSSVNLDFMWAELDDEYQDDWSTDGDDLLSLKKSDDQTSLLVVGIGGTRAVLSKGSAKDYHFQVKFTPLKSGDFGLFLRGDCQSGYGYYLLMDGVNTGTWRINKHGLFAQKAQTMELAKGEIVNYEMEKGKPYWLKAEMKGQNLKFYFSVDGQEFTKLGEISDSSYHSGGLGMAVSNGHLVLVNDIQYSRY